MNEITLKVEFPHQVIQRQALTKIAQDVKKFCRQHQKIFSLSTALTSPSFSFLLDNLERKGPVGSQCAVILLDLVQNSLVCETIIYTSCFAKSALDCPIENYCWLILRLLPCDNSSLFTLQTHPVTRLLFNKPNSSLQIFSCTQTFLLEMHKKELTTENVRSNIHIHSLMNEITLKVEFPHQVIQRQALTKIAQDVKKFCRQHQKIFSLSTALTSPSFSFLLDNLERKGPVGSQCAVILLDLVQNSLVCETIIYTSCFAKSALDCPIENYCWLILRLLPCDNSSLFTLQTHPVTRLLFNKPNSSLQIFSCTQTFLLEMHKKELTTENVSLMSSAFLSLLPFFKHVFQETNDGLSLLNVLLDLCEIIGHCSKQRATKIFIQVVVLCKTRNVVDNSQANFVLISNKLTSWFLNHSYIDREMTEEFIWLIMTGLWNEVKSNSQSHLLSSFIILKQLLIHHRNKNIGKICSAFAFLLMKAFDPLFLKEALMSVYLLLSDSQLTSLSGTVSVLALPLLRILYTFQDDDLHCLASNILLNIAQINIEDHNCFQKTEVLEYSELFMICSSSCATLASLLRSKGFAKAWLKDFSIMIPSANLVAVQTTSLLLSSLMISCRENNIFEASLDVVEEICLKFPTFVLDFLPLLFYCLRRSKFQSKLKILYIIPHLATAKELTGIILKAIMLLSNNNQMRPLSINLMTVLWQKQPRTLPYLLKLLNKRISKSEIHIQLWYDILLSKLLAVQKITMQGSLYGKDMMVFLSGALDELTSLKPPLLHQHTVSLSFLIESFKNLCLSEIVAIETLWKTVCTRLQEHSLTSLCSFLSCAFEASPNNTILHSEVTTYLWHIVAEEKDPSVLNAAYIALSKFPMELFKVKHLPDVLRSNVIEQMFREKNNDYDPTDEPCPRFAILLLRKYIPKQTLPGFRTFLTEALQQEISSLPRGVGHSEKVASQRHVTSQLSTVLHREYEQSNRAGVLSGLAAGVLCCFESSAESEQRGLQSDVYKKTLDSLLVDFSLDIKDWSHITMAPNHWCRFMKNMFNAIFEDRTARIKVQKEKNEIGDETFVVEMNAREFWVRDQITNQLQKASKGSPRSQGNSVMALAGLVHAVVSRGTTNESVKCQQYVSMRSWSSKVCDTVMVVLDGSYKPASETFKWCQQVSTDGTTSSSLLARSYAALSMCQLVLPLLSFNENRISTLLWMVQNRCPGQPKSDSSDSLQFYCSVGLGMLLSQLYQARFPDFVGECKDIHNALKVLEDLALNPEPYGGAMIGLANALSSLWLSDFNVEMKYWSMTRQKLLLNLDNNLLVGETCFAIACLTATQYELGNLSTGEVLSLIKRLIEKSKNVKSNDVSISLGILSHVISLTEPSDGTVVISLFETWHDHLAKGEISQQFEAAKGIFAAFGIHEWLYVGDVRSIVHPSLKRCISTSHKLFTKCNDILLCTYLARMFGMACFRDYHKTVATPQDYNYLKGDYLLFHVFQELKRAVKYKDTNETDVDCLLHAISNVANCSLPQVNWTLVLNPLMKIGFSNEFTKTCLVFAFAHANSSPSLLLWISSFLETGVFARQTSNIQKYLLISTVQILPRLVIKRQRSILEEIPIYCFKVNDDKSTFLAWVLQQWVSVAKMTSPPPTVFPLLRNVLKKMVQLSELTKTVVSDESLFEFAELFYLLFKDTWRIELLEVCEGQLVQRIYLQILQSFSSTKVEDVQCVLDFEHLHETNMSILLTKNICFVPPREMFTNNLRNLLKTKYCKKKHSDVWLALIKLCEGEYSDCLISPIYQLAYSSMLPTSENVYLST